MITIDELIDTVRAQLRGKSRDQVELDADSDIDDIGLSSLQMAEVLFTLEEQHGIEMDLVRASEARTLGAIAALVNESLAGQPG